jgi:hypothetical protein
VHYDHQAHSSSDILLLLRDVGLLVEETARGLGEDLPEGVPGHSTTSTSIVDTLTDLDRRVAALTGHQVDLKLLFPVALGGLGAWQLVKRGFGFSEVPAYVLLWFAFDSFWKFHRRPTTSADADTDPTTLHQPDGKGCFEGGVITRA